ncbi:MAG: hypothetical protein VKI82_06435 [Leptolyngbya sp.]|nr:hypothetical protein [Leptolyngbya sp.]
MSHGFRFSPCHAAVACLVSAVVLGGHPAQPPAAASPGDHPPHSSPTQPHSPASTSDDPPAPPAEPAHLPPTEGNHHSHHSLEIPVDQPVPTVSLVVHPDAVQGWNLELQTTHFRFAPELVNQANQPGLGHGHLYINGEKQGRIYGPWLHLAQLPPGPNTITVSLNANGHEALTHYGQPITATVVIEVPE